MISYHPDDGKCAPLPRVWDLFSTVIAQPKLALIYKG